MAGNGLPLVASHLRRAVATSSGPLSQQTWRGIPRIAISSRSTSSTCSDVQRRSTSSARHSRV